MKKLFLTFFIALTIFFVTDSITLAANNGEEYDDYPCVKIVVEELNADGSRDAMENLEKIAALSKKELIDFDEILRNPDKLAEELSKPENLNVELVDMDYFQKVESYDKDNFQKFGLRKYNIRPSALGYSGRVTVITSLRALGIDLIKYELTGEFTVNSTKTRFISADRMDGVVIRKWLPQVVTKKIGTPTKSVTDTQFTGQVTFSYDLGVGSWGIARIGVVRTGFTANTKQVTNSWAYTE